MGKNVIQFPKNKKLPKSVEKLLKLANELDDVIIKSLSSGEYEPREVAVLLGHRLGSLIRLFKKGEKEHILNACINILTTQAKKED